MRAPRCHNRTVTRTTVFEFYDSRAGMCRLVPKRVLPFGIFKTTVLACDPLCHVAPCGWFGICLQNLSPRMSAFHPKLTYPTRGTTSATRRGHAIHGNERLHCRRCKLGAWSLHVGYRHYLHDFYPGAGHLQMRMVFAEYLSGC